jgi:hypothetical protein
MPNWKRVIVSGSDASLNSLQVITSVSASVFTGSFTGSLFGTASWAQNAVTASYALSAGAAIIVTGSNAILNQTTPATTWSFDHNLNTKYPVFQVYNSSDEVVIPSKIVAVSNNNALIYFPTALTGVAVADIGGYTGSIQNTSASYAYTASSAVNSFNAISASYALTASYALNAATAASFPFTGSAQITGSLGVTGSIFATNIIVSGSLTISSASLSYQQNLSVATGSYQTIVSVATGSFRCAFFDYVTFNGSTVRAGIVVSTWSGSATEYYENYTNDIGGSTAVVDLRTTISGSNIQLQAGISGSAWSVRSLVRLL